MMMIMRMMRMTMTMTECAQIASPDGQELKTASKLILWLPKRGQQQSAAQFLYTIFRNGTQLIIVLKIAGVELKKTNSVGAPVPHVGNKTPFWAAPFQQPTLLYQPPSAQQHLHRPGAVGWLCDWNLENPGNKGNWRTYGYYSGILHLWVQAVHHGPSLAVPCGMGAPGTSTKTANRAKIGYVPPTSPNIT